MVQNYINSKEVLFFGRGGGGGGGGLGSYLKNYLYFIIMFYSFLKNYFFLRNYSV